MTAKTSGEFRIAGGSTGHGESGYGTEPAIPPEVAQQFCQLEGLGQRAGLHVLDTDKGPYGTAFGEDGRPQMVLTAGWQTVGEGPHYDHATGSFVVTVCKPTESLTEGSVAADAAGADDYDTRQVDIAHLFGLNEERIKAVERYDRYRRLGKQAARLVQRWLPGRGKDGDSQPAQVTEVNRG